MQMRLSGDQRSQGQCLLSLSSAASAGRLGPVSAARFGREGRGQTSTLTC